MSKLVRFLSIKTGLSELDVERIINRAPDTYKSYPIPKRNGKGERIISQPAREVKVLQRVLVERLHDLPIHDAAMAYRKGVSIRSNALKHSQNGPIRKYDFQSFFPSIKGSDWEHYCLQHQIFSDPSDVARSVNLLFHRAARGHILRLAIGAPASPWLSNVLLYEFDDSVSRAVAKDRVTYTRYADDLTFSAPRTGHLTVVDGIVRRTISEIDSPRLKLNEAKTTVATKKYRRVVTGLILSDNGEVSIGRDKKRLVRAQVHHALENSVGEKNANKLLGYIAHVRSVEPSFYYKLLAHYGEDFEARVRMKSASVEPSI
ncbi:hypothetical protein M2341_001081 [Sphingobium sp. B7D2B]|uniref:retron St85 family RNA-directed DNA polymerase n=1 Tax=Sphingobium sp. B7D2B TaxID=2940583 RepID=UPI0022258AE0|nr:retron St85 family RNA-directed DNA polymerase [Sphingobium sp. B7D2B]MCW2365634.1 hypothetical protein [Sphingobium sp. B7D2B]